MGKNNVVVASAAFIVMSSLIKKRKKRRWWVTPLYQDRLSTRGPSFIRRLIQEEDGHFRNFVRIAAADFLFILEAIREKISKSDTNYRKSVTADERLAITLRFLATGDSYTSLKYVFNTSKQLISQIVPEVCEAIIETLIHHVTMPSSSQEWMEVASGFNRTWNFPNCVGALDGRHIALQAPTQSGSTFYNYKSFFSIVLMALVDSDYNFLSVDIGAQGGILDRGVFKNCQLYNDLLANKLNLPMHVSLPGITTELPFVFLGDQAFALGTKIMKLYSGLHPQGSRERIFNYRLSKARRVSENAFDILSTVFRVLRKLLLLEPPKAELVVMAIICLHNFLLCSSTSKNMYTPNGTFDKEEDGRIIPGTWRMENNNSGTGLEDLKKVPRKPAKDAEQIRDQFAKYFSSDGAVLWQDDYAYRILFVNLQI